MEELCPWCPFEDKEHSDFCPSSEKLRQEIVGPLPYAVHHPFPGVKTKEEETEPN